MASLAAGSGRPGPPGLLASSAVFSLGLLLQWGLGLVEAALVGRHDPGAAAAVSVGTFAVLLWLSALLGAGPAVQALSARGPGAGGVPRRPLAQAHLYVLLVGIPLSLLLLAGSGRVAGTLAADGAQAADLAEYLAVRAFGLVPTALALSLRGHFLAAGRPLAYLAAVAAGALVQLALYRLLIFGGAGIEALGLQGAAWAAVLGNAAVALAGWAAVLAGPPPQGAEPGAAPAGFPAFARLALGSGMFQTFAVAINVVVLWFFSRLGPGELAAAGLALQAVSLALVPAQALGMVLGRAVLAEPDPRAWSRALAATGIAYLVLGAVLAATGALAVPALFPDPQAQGLARGTFALAGLALAPEALGLALLYQTLAEGRARLLLRAVVPYQAVVALPLAYAVGVAALGSYHAVWILVILTRLGQTAWLLVRARERLRAGAR